MAGRNLKIQFRRVPNRPAKPPIAQPQDGSFRMHVLPEAPASTKLACQIVPIEVPQDLLQPFGLEHGMQHNPSVAMHYGELYVNIRVLDRTKSHNFLGILDRTSLQPKNLRHLEDDSANHRNTQVRTSGFEDLRLFSMRGKLMASATTCNRVPDDPRPKIAVLELDDDHTKIVKAHVQPSNVNEKNWMPIVDQGLSLRFVYAVEPAVTVLRYDESTCKVVPDVTKLPTRTGIIRGSSQLLPFDDGYLAVVHQLHAGRPTYMHRFAMFDHELREVALGKPFYFKERGIEFCAGMAKWKDQFILSFGVSDTSANLAVVDEKVVREMLNV